MSNTVLHWYTKKAALVASVSFSSFPYFLATFSWGCFLNLICRTVLLSLLLLSLLLSSLLLLLY